MNIVVCVKETIDVQDHLTVENGAVNVNALVTHDTISSLDLYALEAALSLKERSGGKVTVVAVGRASADNSLRQCLAMGADDAILLCDTAFHNSDSYGVAFLLAKVIAGLPHDVVCCGHKADDTQFGLTGVHLAQLLGLPLARNVIKVELQKDQLRLERKLEKGNRELVSCALPLLLAFEAGAVPPRHTTIKAVLKARRQTINQLDAPGLGVKSEELRKMMKVKIENLTLPKPKMRGLFIPDVKMSAAAKMMAIMGGGLVQKKSNLLQGDTTEIVRQVAEFLKKEKVLKL